MGSDDYNYEEMASQDLPNDDRRRVGWDSPVSSEGGSGESGSHSDAETVDGFDIETHQHGELEDVPGFDKEEAMVGTFGLREHRAVDHDLWHIPRSCDLEYGDAPETVCGVDDRKAIEAVTGVPWRMICQLIITLADGRRSRCTGWFTAPRTVMTAGHCVYSHAGGGWAKSIEVIPGMNDRLRPFGSATSESFRSVKGWVQGSREERPLYDYGCVILPKDKPLGTKTGWFGFANLSDANLRDLLANNSGYPGDKPFGTQWFNAGRISRVEKHRFQYMIDTAGGQSGSPTWRFSKGKRHVIGIHAYGGCPNKSTRITKSVYANMQSWKQQGS